MASQAVMPARLRTWCLALPEVWEGASNGLPAMVAGKRTFLLLDETRSPPVIHFKASPQEAAAYLCDRRFQAAPSHASHGWLALGIPDAVDWTLLREVALGSYRQVALQRMLKALERMARVL